MSTQLISVTKQDTINHFKQVLMKTFANTIFLFDEEPEDPAWNLIVYWQETEIGPSKFDVRQIVNLFQSTSVGHEYGWVVRYWYYAPEGTITVALDPAREIKNLPHHPDAQQVIWDLGSVRLVYATGQTLTEIFN